MRILEKQEKKSISKVSILFQKLFICRHRIKKKPKRYISYATIDIKCSNKPKDVESKSVTESEAKTRNPESATVSSQNNLADLVAALNRFKTATAVSRLISLYSNKNIHAN